MKKSILTMTVLLTVVFAHAETDSFTQSVKCSGGATELNSGKWAKFVFKINDTYQEDVDSILNIHNVEITTTKMGLFSNTKTYAHPDFSRNCRLSNNVVSCNGTGIGTGEQEFELDINLRTMKAQGKYKLGGYPNDDYNEVYTFGAENLLNCSM